MDCVNHPGVEANWHCQDCDKYYCRSCKVEQVFGAYSRVEICPVCRNALQELEGVQYITIVPFWDRLPGILAYPLKGDGPALLIPTVLLVYFFSVFRVGLLPFFNVVVSQEIEFRAGKQPGMTAQHNAKQR